MAVGKRRAKRQIRTMSEGTDAIEEVLGILRMAGIRVEFAWQIPDVIRQLVGQAPTGNAGFGYSQVGMTSPPPRALPGPTLAYPQAPPQHRSPTETMQAMTQGQPRQMRLPPQQQTAPQTRPAPAARGKKEVDEDLPIDSSLVDDLFDEFGEPELELDAEPPDPNRLTRMVAEVEAGQARMMRRVAEEGVRYGGGMPSPAEGKKLVPHPSTPKRLVEATSPAPSDEELEEMNLGIPSYGEEAEVNSHVPGDERVDPKTGQTLGEKRRIMQSILGKDMKPPTPGRPNIGVAMGGPRRG